MCKFEQKLLLMERRMTGNCHVRCGTGENSEIISKSYLSSSFEMITIAMEGKRLGLHNKSLFAVPNSLTEQMGRDFKKLYPAANVLVAKKKDFEPKNRKMLFAKIATGEWDAVIVGHSQFDRMGLSKDRMEKYMQAEIGDLREQLEEAKDKDGSKSFSVKEIEKTIARYEKKVKDSSEKVAKDDYIDFEEMGFDKLFVDECHLYKNLGTATKMSNVAGIGTTGSGKAAELLMKTKYFDELTGGKGMVFASGTPIITGYLRSEMPILRCFYYLFLKLPWAAPVSLLKSFGEIAVVVKAAKAADGVYGIGGVLYHVRRISQAVIFQILKRGLTRYVPEAPENLAFADECGGSHVIKSDLFGVMVVDKKQYVTEPCLLGNAGGRVR